MNGYKNTETYKAAIWIKNDKLIFENTQNLGGAELRSWMNGLIAVAKTSHCKCLNEIKEAVETIGDISVVNWEEIVNELGGTK